jgi:cobalamin biosynthesis Co2+ chelatase CbiK
MYITKEFREIICTKFRKISQKKVQRNFAEFREIKSLSSLFRILRNKKILFHDHPNQNLQRYKAKHFASVVIFGIYEIEDTSKDA